MTFVSGLQLARLTAQEAEPVLRRRWPNVPIALALIGPGSDVLGFDTERSMDHDWGPRVTIVVPSSDLDAVRGDVEEIVRGLPAFVGGHPTRNTQHDDGTLFGDPDGGLHRVQVTSVANLLLENCGVSTLDDMDATDWLATPMQSLLELTSGEVIVDDSGELTDLRIRLSFYPQDVWPYQLSSLWMRVSQMQPFVARAGEANDEVGSAVIAAGIARDMMRIGLVQSRVYAPYANGWGRRRAAARLAQSCSLRSGRSPGRHVGDPESRRWSRRVTC